MRGRSYPMGQWSPGAHLPSGRRPAVGRRGGGRDAGRPDPGQAAARLGARERAARCGWCAASPTGADETRALAAALAGAVPCPATSLLLAGDLGAGKTTFAQGFGAGLGVAEPVTSPTFTLVRQYPLSARRAGPDACCHADVYRLDHLHEIVDLGLGRAGRGRRRGPGRVGRRGRARPRRGIAGRPLGWRRRRGHDRRRGPARSSPSARSATAWAGRWDAPGGRARPVGGATVILLAIESATDLVGVALLRRRRRRRPSASTSGGRAHAELLAPAIEEVCAVVRVHRRRRRRDRRRRRPRAVHRAPGRGGHGQGPGPGAGHRRRSGVEQPRRPGRGGRAPAAGPVRAGPVVAGGRRPPRRGVRRRLPVRPATTAGSACGSGRPGRSSTTGRARSTPEALAAWLLALADGRRVRCSWSGTARSATSALFGQLAPASTSAWPTQLLGAPARWPWPAWPASGSRRAPGAVGARGRRARLPAGGRCPHQLGAAGPAAPARPAARDTGPGGGRASVNATSTRPGRPAGGHRPHAHQGPAGRAARSRRRCSRSPWSHRLFVEELAQRKSRAYRAAWVGRDIVGFAGQMFIDDEAHVNNIAVDPAWQGRGLGRRPPARPGPHRPSTGGPGTSPSRSGWATSPPWPCTGGSAWPRSGCVRNYYPRPARTP